MNDEPQLASTQRPRGLKIYTGFIVLFACLVVSGMMGDLAESRPENFSLEKLNPDWVIMLLSYLFIFFGLIGGIWQRKQWARVLAICLHILLILSLIPILSQVRQPAGIGISVVYLLINWRALSWLSRHGHHFGQRT